jgi:hypothetical protein
MEQTESGSIVIKFHVIPSFNFVLEKLPEPPKEAREEKALEAKVFDLFEPVEVGRRRHVILLIVVMIAISL